jgi:alpha-L-rhamnosidase
MENIMYSRNHPMFASYDAWFYRHIGGVRIGGFGASEVEIRPYLPSTLTRASCSYDGPRGSIVSEWERTGEGVRYFVTIPVGTSAHISVEGTVTSVNGKAAAFKKAADGRTVFPAAPGSYTILTR